MHPSIRTTISPLFSFAIFAFFAVNPIAFRQIAFAASEPAYAKTIAKLPKLTGDERWQLLHPKTPESK